MNFLVQDKLESRRGYNFKKQLRAGHKNLAPILRRSGLCLGVVLGMAGVISGPSTGVIGDIISVTLYGGLIFLLFVVARYINDFAVLHNIDNTKEIYERNNTGVGFAEFGCFVATGIMAMASMTGTGGVGSAIAYFIIGQIILLGAVFGYEILTKWSIMDSIREGNTSTGIHIGSMAVAISLALYGVIAQDFEGYSGVLYDVVFEGLFALAVLFGATIVIDKLFLPSIIIEEELDVKGNVGVAVMLAALHVIAGLAISAAIT